MESETRAALERLEAKVDTIYASVEKTRKYFLVIIWVTVVTLVLPGIALVFALPAFLNSYMGMLGGV